MHNFVYLAQRCSQGFSCEPNFGGRAPRPPGCATALAVTTAVQTVIPVQWRVAGSAGRCRDGAGAQNTYCRLAANKSHARLLAAARRAPESIARGRSVGRHPATPNTEAPTHPRRSVCRINVPNCGAGRQ